MDRLEAIRLFIRVVQTGSFAAAAREAQVGQPAVSKQIAALEIHLGAQLIRRTSRSMNLTEAGQTFFESAVRLVAEFDSAESLVGKGQSAPSGKIRVVVPPVFGRLCIVPALPHFFELYPQITLEMVAARWQVNLIEEGMDVGILHGDMMDSSMIARKIAQTPFVTVATPGYLKKRGTPRAIQDLEKHSLIIFAPEREPRPWRFKETSEPSLYQAQGRFWAGDGEQMRSAVLAGLGIGHSPSWVFLPEIRSGEVRTVLNEHELISSPIHAVHHAGHRLPTKSRVFIDYLAQTFASDPNLALK